MGCKWLCCRPACDRLQHRSLHFRKTTILKKPADLTNNHETFGENRARLIVRDQIEVTLTITRLDTLQAVPFFRQRPERLRQQLQLVHLQRWLARFSCETGSFHADEIAQIEQLKDFHGLRAEFLCLQINLHPSTRVFEINKVALAHVAMCTDPARDAKTGAFGKFLPRLRNIAGGFERCAERSDPKLFQSR